MPYRRSYRRGYRRSSRAISGTRVPRRGAVKEFPKFARAVVPRKQIHFWPNSPSGNYNLVFASNLTPEWAGLTTSGLTPPVTGANGFSCLHLSNIVQGSGIEQREGVSVMNRNLLIRGVVQLRGNVVGAQPIVAPGNVPFGELLLVYDREPDQHLTTVPPLTDLLENGVMTAPMRMDNRDRFDVLLRKKLSFELMAGLSAVTYVMARGYWLDMKVPIYRVTTYKSGVVTPATPGDVRKGALYLYFLSFIGGTNDACPMFQGYVKLSFTDMD